MSYKVKFLGQGVMGEEALRVLKTERNVELVEDGEYDVLLVASWSKRIEQEVIDKAKICSVNIHSGLLPRQRGYHPLNWAIIWGDQVCGVSLHMIAESIDSGDIVLQKAFTIGEDDFIWDVRKKAVACVAPIIRTFFDNVEEALSKRWKQNQAFVTYAPRRFPSDSEVNLNAPIKDIYNLFRSCDKDYPAYAYVDNVKRYIKEFINRSVIVYED